MGMRDSSIMGSLMENWPPILWAVSLQNLRKSDDGRKLTPDEANN